MEISVGATVVFGGAGFVGKAIAEQLGADGYRVRVASRAPLDPAARPPSRIEAVQADVRADEDIHVSGMLVGSSPADVSHEQRAKKAAEAPLPLSAFRSRSSAQRF